jgi:hypothetical protein
MTYGLGRTFGLGGLADADGATRAACEAAVQRHFEAVGRRDWAAAARPWVGVAGGGASEAMVMRMLEEQARRVGDLRSARAERVTVAGASGAETCHAVYSVTCATATQGEVFDLARRPGDAEFRVTGYCGACADDAGAGRPTPGPP